MSVVHIQDRKNVLSGTVLSGKCDYTNAFTFLMINLKCAAMHLSRFPTRLKIHRTLLLQKCESGISLKSFQAFSVNYHFAQLQMSRLS